MTDYNGELYCNGQTIWKALTINLDKKTFIVKLIYEIVKCWSI